MYIQSGFLDNYEKEKKELSKPNPKHSARNFPIK